MVSGKDTRQIGDGEVALAADTAATSGNLSSAANGDTPPTYSRKTVVLHWLTVLCLAAAVTLVLTREQIGGRTARQWLLEGHRHFGLLVLVLFVVRVALRVRGGKQTSIEKMPRIVRVLAGLTHVALYALLLALPLIGWSLSNAQDKPVHFFGITLPALVAADDDLADTLQAWHMNAAWVLLALVCLHIAASLWHHFVLRDDVLRSMLPNRRR